MRTQRYPRVLIINGESISATTATGITMSNLFAGWPAEQLAQVFTSSLPCKRRADFEYHLAPTERLGLRWLRSRMRISRSAGTGLKTPSWKNEGAASRQIRDVVLPSLRKWLDLLPYELPEHIEKSIVQFRPDVVHTCLGNIQIAALALHCAQLCSVGIIPHFMDDWKSTLYAGRLDLVLQRRILLSLVHRIIKAAPVGMSISELMAAEYSSAFGVPFHSFMNCTSVAAEIEPMAVLDPTVGPRLVYAGGLQNERWRSLKEIGEALGYLNSEGFLGKLYIYAPAKDISEFRDRIAGPSVEIVGFLAQHEVAGVLKSGHVMVHVESFENSTRKYTRLSMSTKIPQYLAAGRPLFCYGPSEVCSCRFIKENQCGVVVGSQDKSDLVAALRGMLRDTTLRRRLGENAWIIARKKFNANDVRERFRNVIAQAAWGSSEQESQVFEDRQGTRL